MLTATLPRVRAGSAVLKEIEVRFFDAAVPILGITDERGRYATYLVKVGRSDLPGRYFRLERSDEATYDCLVSPDLAECQCGCRGFEKWGSCKHIHALLKLVSGELEPEETIVPF